MQPGASDLPSKNSQSAANQQQRTTNYTMTHCSVVLWALLLSHCASHAHSYEAGSAPPCWELVCGSHDAAISGQQVGGVCQVSCRGACDCDAWGGGICQCTSNASPPLPIGGLNDQCSIKVWVMKESQALSAGVAAIGSVLDGGSADDAAGAAAKHGATCDAEPTFEGGCRDVVAGLTAMPGVTVPANYCSDLCSRSCYGGLWFNSPCMTDSEVIPEFAHSGPALFTVQIHCSVPWTLLLLTVLFIAIALCRLKCRRSKNSKAAAPFIVGQQPTAVVYAVPMMSQQQQQRYSPPLL